MEPKRHPTPAAARSVPLLLSLVLFAAGCGKHPMSAADEVQDIRLADVAAEAGIDVVTISGDPRRWYIPESNGTGAAWLDYDGDGRMDLFVGNGAALRYIDDGRRLEVVSETTSRLYRNDGGMRFTDVTEASGAGRHEWINGVAVADVDGDGFPDIYLACFGPDVFLRNVGGRFADVTEEVGLGNELWAASAAFGDVDNDGNLDLFVANYVLFDPENPPMEGQRMVYEGVEIGWGPEPEAGPGINPGAPNVFYLGDGTGRFTEATAAAGLALAEPLCSYAVVFSDVDRDGRQDILVANDMQPTSLFHNKGDGRFVEEGVRRGFAYSARGESTAAMGLFVGDFEGDGDFDVIRTNFDLEPNCLHVNDGNGWFEDRAERHGLAAPSRDRLGWGGGFFDVDCDGYLDVLVANGHVLPQAEAIGMSPWAQQSQLFRGQPSPGLGVTWRDVTLESGPGLLPRRSSRGVAFGDPNDDGDIDVLIIDIDHAPRLLENQSRGQGRWISVRAIGAGRNRDALGGVVTVHAGGRSWAREVRFTDGLYSSHDPRLHFGLGPVEAIDRVEVRWPAGGGVTRIEAPPLDNFLTVRQDPEQHR